MNGITVKEAAEKWGITPRQVQFLCSKGRITGAVRFGHAWVIPADASKPKDGRAVSMSKDREVRNEDN